MKGRPLMALGLLLLAPIRSVDEALAAWPANGIHAINEAGVDKNNNGNKNNKGSKNKKNSDCKKNTTKQQKAQQS